MSDLLSGETLLQYRFDKGWSAANVAYDAKNQQILVVGAVQDCETPIARIPYDGNQI